MVGDTVNPDPPQLGPFVGVVVDEQADCGIGRDVRQSAQPLRCLRFRVDGGVHDVVTWVASASTANTTGTRCGFPSGVLVASRATGDCVKLTLGSNPPIVPAYGLEQCFK